MSWWVRKLEGEGTSVDIFKSTKVDLHPVEKLLMLISTILVDFVVFLVGYTLLVDMEGFNFSGTMMILVAIIHTVVTYVALIGNGLNKGL